LSGLLIETLLPPQRYTSAQLDSAAKIAWAIRHWDGGRGKFLLLEPPRRG